MQNSNQSRFSKISEKDREVLTRLAGRIVKRGLAVPVVFFLEMTKYVAFIGSQTLVFFGPLVTAFIDAEPFYRIVELMEERRNIEFLICEVERLEAESKAETDKRQSKKSDQLEK